MTIRKILPILFILFFAVIILVGFYFYNSRREIQVVGNKYYNIIYKESALFNEHLNELGVWKKNNPEIYKINKGNQTIQLIRIEITDKEQRLYKSFDSIDTQKIFSSSSSFVDDKGTLHVVIYLNPELANASDIEFANTTFLFSVLNSLYVSTHSGVSPDEVYEKGRHDLGTFYKNPKARPFTISIKQ